ncbi:hypothetical protein [Pedobacter boryungensis]|uniref:YD repeat-containing protein n=1 Tax=Pedobacter boryungensis TaxID=869962 RepID=A0ABX2DG78_9SPHI|nr:hypothetical protein [Pedobacter boryungensis]NQX32301.1 hypothetical protein [Pedobacter boryungensis]
MRKNILYSLIALMGLFTACKKGTDPKPVDPIVIADPYKNSRPIMLTSDDGTSLKYYYNTENQIIKVEYFNKPGVVYSSQKSTYSNGRLVQVLLENVNSIKYVTDYKYQGNTNLIESTNFTATDYQNPASPVVTLTSSQEYSYLGGNIFKITTKNVDNAPTMINTFTFSLKGGNPFVTTDYIPQSINGIPASDSYHSTIEYYKDIIDPVYYFFTNSTIASKFIQKNGTFSANNSSYNQTYELDDLGRLKTVTAVTLNNSITQSVVKTTYTYESY